VADVADELEQPSETVMADDVSTDESDEDDLEETDGRFARRNPLIEKSLGGG
jgi:hypothetical protein